MLPRKRALFFLDLGGTKIRIRMIEGLCDHLCRLGYEVQKLRNLPPGLPGCVRNYDEIFVWNGETERSRIVVDASRKYGKNISFLEVGYFSQKDHIMLTSGGSVGGALMRAESPPSPQDDDHEYLRLFFNRYSLGRDWQDSSCGTVLCLLQLAWDMAVRRYSDVKTTQQLVDRVESMFPDDSVLFRRHPKDQKTKIKTRHPISTSSSLWDDVLPARIVIAINSTALYESVLAGKPVVAIGECPLKIFPTLSQQRAVVREIIARQIPINSRDITQFIFRNLKRSF